MIPSAQLLNPHKAPLENSTLKTTQLARVTEVQNVAPQHFRLTLQAPLIASQAQAGQFVHILPRSSANSDPFLRRAFSIMAVDREHIQVLFRTQGRGTAYLAEARPGDILDVLGPLGRPFDVSPFHVKQDANITAILVGGGVGVPPLVLLGKTLRAMGVSPLAIVGARTASDVIGESDFKELPIDLHIATDDGSRGHQGRVTDLLEQSLDLQKSSAIIYSCGPWPMLKAVAQTALHRQIRCQVSMEENMPCGIGVCNGCVVEMKDSETGNEGRAVSEYDRYRRICVEGPAVWADEIEWGTL
jgi:dihydroorotate dehydrogenase electron transfer subunit